MKARTWALLAITLVGCGGDTASYNLSVVVRTVVPPRTRFFSVSTEIYAPGDASQPLASDEYLTKEDDDFRDQGVRVAEATLEQGLYRVLTSLLAEDGIEIASQEQWVAISSDYELSLQLGRELCDVYETPLVSDASVVAACSGKTWFECSQAADVLCTAQSELNTESCWIGGVGYVEGASVRLICLGYAGAVRMTASLATLSAALGTSGATSPLTADSVKTRRGAQAVHTHCIERGFGGGLGPQLVDARMDVHFVCIDRELATVKSAADSFFEGECSYSTMPESQACSEAASALCRTLKYPIGFGPVTAPEESAGVIEALCL